VNDKITVVRKKQGLLAEFERLNEVMQEYASFLRMQESPESAGQNAVQVLRGQQLALQQARASLRTVDLVCVLIRQVVTGLTMERFSFKSLPDFRLDEVAEDEVAEDGGNQRSPEQLVAWVSNSVSKAPLEIQQKVRDLLGSILAFFRELSEENVRGVEDALTRMNILTSNSKTQALVREIAVITRDIFGSLQHLSEGLPLDSLSESSGGISDAVKKLKSVIVRLDGAAVENLDNLEKVNKLAGGEGASMEGVIESLHEVQRVLMTMKEEHPDVAERVGRIQDRLGDEVGASLMEFQLSPKNYQDIHLELISNQSFQELTSRTLGKIIDFVESLEREMLDLLREFRPALGLAGPAPATPASGLSTQPENAGKAAGVAEEPESGGVQQSQEDVDKLMDELGF